MQEQKWLLGLLGAFRLEQDGHVVQRLRPTKQNLVLAYLGTAPLIEHPRSDVAATFWPDKPPKTALRYLSFTLCLLRDRLRKLGLLDPVYVSRLTLQLNPTISTDAQLFQQRLLAASPDEPSRDRASRLQRALASYGGELLPTVAAPWVEPERDRLAKLYEGGLSELSDILHTGTDLRELARDVPPSAWRELAERPAIAAPSPVSAPELSEEVSTSAAPSSSGYTELVTFAREATEALSGADHHLWLDRLRARDAAFRAALDIQVTSPDSALGLELAGALLHYWLLSGSVDDGLWYLEKLLAQPSTASVPTRAEALHAAGTLAYKAGNLQLAKARLDDAVALWEQAGDEGGLIRTISNRATVSYGAGDYESAQRDYRRCIAEARERADENALSQLLLNAALTEIRLGAAAPAQELLQERRELAERSGDTRGVAITLSHLASVALMDERNDDARSYAQGAAELLDEAREPGASSIVHRVLGRAAYLEKDYEAAFARFHDSMQLAKASGDVRELAETMRYLAATFAAIGHIRRAEALLHQARGLLDAVGDRHGAGKADDALEQLKGGRGG